MTENSNEAGKASARQTRRSFLVGGIAAAAGTGGLTWLARAGL